METIICYVSSEARGNPGSAAIGIVISDASGQVLAEEAQAIGNASTIFAEYNAVMIGLHTLQSIYGVETTNRQFEIRLVNKEVAGQLNNQSPITDPGLVPMFMEIHNMQVTAFSNLTITLVPTDDNTVARQLVKEVLDGKE